LKQFKPLKAIALLLLSLTLSGCASRVVTETEYIEVPVEVPIPLDPELTRDVPPPDFDVQTWRDVAILAIHYRQRYEALRERMNVIRGIQGHE
jgi:hypothetical protein